MGAADAAGHGVRQDDGGQRTLLFIGDGEAAMPDVRGEIERTAARHGLEAQRRGGVGDLRRRDGEAAARAGLAVKGQQRHRLAELRIRQRQEGGDVLCVRRGAPTRAIQRKQWRGCGTDLAADLRRQRPQRRQCQRFAARQGEADGPFARRQRAVQHRVDAFQDGEIQLAPQADGCTQPLIVHRETAGRQRQRRQATARQHRLQAARRAGAILFRHQRRDPQQRPFRGPHRQGRGERQGGDTTMPRHLRLRIHGKGAQIVRHRRPQRRIHRQYR